MIHSSCLTENDEQNAAHMTRQDTEESDLIFNEKEGNRRGR